MDAPHLPFDLVVDLQILVERLPERWFGCLSPDMRVRFEILRVTEPKAERAIIADAVRGFAEMLPTFTRSDDVRAVASRMPRLAMLLRHSDLDFDLGTTDVLAALEIVRSPRPPSMSRLVRRLLAQEDGWETVRSVWPRLPRFRRRFEMFEDGHDLARRLRRELGSTPKRERPQCGARTRSGAPCQARAVWDHEHDRPRTKRGRCRMHGGLSTGPRTEAGKAAARAALHRLNLARQQGGIAEAA